MTANEITRLEQEHNVKVLDHQVSADASELVDGDTVLWEVAVDTSRGEHMTFYVDSETLALEWDVHGHPSWFAPSKIRGRRPGKQTR